MSSIRIGSGSTPAGSTNWQPYQGGTTGIFVDVNTSAASFKTTPVYTTSIAGNSSHWATTGASSVYNASPTGFRIYIRWVDGHALTPAQANGFQWRINWVGVES